MFPLLPKGDQIKLLKIFRLKIFSICHRCQRHRWLTLSCEYLREFSKKFETVLMEYSGAGGKLIHEKNQKHKISWHCPFKDVEKFGLTSIQYSITFSFLAGNFNIIVFFYSYNVWSNNSIFGLTWRRICVNKKQQSGRKYIGGKQSFLIIACVP